ncbi:SCO family protein [Natrinema versiforme]|uniref:SCO family protein n=1 Tax=Natrinema versiforme TaxID=88724 RepID=A0A4P8WG90_9EURY|nr:SCO family protein [Natrinema versiforme]QCS42085.1 SCO family protein [Natrinema versiforme]
MDRRTYLGTAGIAGLTSVAGCLGGDGENTGDTDDTDTVLGNPDVRRGDPSYPIHGEEFPSFSLQDPIAEETVSLEDFVGERPFVITYFYSSCPDGMCQQLLQHFHRIQEDAMDSDYADELGLLAVTFDPDRDTADPLRSYGTQMGIDVDADHWHFLRPADNETAKTLLKETFGLPLERDDEQSEGSANESTNESANESSDSGGEYTFTHSALVQLVNDRGIVERAYPRASNQRETVNTQVMVEDARTVVGVTE